MENNNGRGIFYGVIGVATLVVAMIGATFAYFSADISTENDPITFNSTTIELSLSQNTAGIKYNLIPVDETLAGFATGGYVGNKTTTTPRDANCIDDDGNEFCSVYEVTITNPSTTTAQTVFARMDVGSNSFATNTRTGGTAEAPQCSDMEAEHAMYCDKSNVAFAIFKGSASQITNWDVDAAATTNYYSSASGSMENALGTEVTAAADTATSDGNVAGTPVLGAIGDMVVGRTASKSTSDSHTLNQLSQTLRPGGSATYTIVMWLHDNGKDQSDDEGQAFAAGITFSTSLNGSGVTAVLATTQAPAN